MIEKKKKWKLADFDYPLPEKYIAQYPAKRRDLAKLMVIHKAVSYTHLTLPTKA